MSLKKRLKDLEERVKPKSDLITIKEVRDIKRLCKCKLADAETEEEKSKLKYRLEKLEEVEKALEMS